MSLGVRYAHKWVDYAIEAVCNFTASGEEDCGVNNPGFGSELGTYPLGRSQSGAARGRARLRRHRDPPAQAAREPLVGGRQLSLQPPARQLVGHRELGRGRRQPAAELRPVVQSSLLLVRREPATSTVGRSGTDRPHQFKVQGTYDFAVGHDGRRQRARRERRAEVDDHEREEHQLLPVRARQSRPRCPRSRRWICCCSRNSGCRTACAPRSALNAINVFDQKTVTGYQTTPYRDQFNVSDATFFSGFDPVAVATASTSGRMRASTWPADSRTSG